MSVHSRPFNPSWLPRLNHRWASTMPMSKRFCTWSLPRWIAAFAAVLFTALGASPAFAQSFSYTNTVNATLSENATPCTNPLQRTYNVTDVFTVGDVDIGMRGSHTYRGDLVMTLEHPDGTRVQVVNGGGSIFGNNFNFRLDDDELQVVNTDGNGTNHTTGGNFQNNFSPNNPLSAFNGKPANGTWTLEICDQFNGDSGTFFHSILFLEAAAGPANRADLSLTKTVNNGTPSNGNLVTYRLTVTNSASSDLTTSATIIDLLPNGAQYFNATGDGDYDPVTGIWETDAIAPGETRQLFIEATVTATAGATITNTAEIATSDEDDPDSTPGNGATSEDDYDTASFTVFGPRVAGTPPTLICPDGQLPFAWSNGDWAVGDDNNDVTVPDLGPVNWDLNLPAGASWLSIGTYGGAHPRLTNVPQSTLSLSVAVEFTNPTQLATIVIDIGEVTEGVQFTVFDVDFIFNDFADFIRVTGQLNGAPAPDPVLTNGISNYVVGNEAFGDAGSGDPQADGNVVVTFDDPIDTITIEYGNHSLAPADPDGQAIQFPGQFNFCRPVADVMVLKSSEVISDGLTTGDDDPFAIPDAVLRYCIQVSNGGSATARDVIATDDLPSSVVYNPGTLRSGATCDGASTVEDDDAAGADESNPFGASYSGGTVTMAISQLDDGNAAAFTFEATVQ